jgi:hypothetical protein
MGNNYELGTIWSQCNLEPTFAQSGDISQTYRQERQTDKPLSSVKME